MENQGLTLKSFNKAMVNGAVAHSIHEYLEHIGGEETLKTGHTIDGDAAQSDNLFVVTGTVRILELWLEVTAVTDATDFAAVKFDLFPVGGAAVDITGTVDGSGCLVGDIFLKNAVKGTALTYIDSALAVVTESAANKNFYPTVLTKKSGAVTNIRVTFNGDGNTDITITAGCRWHPVSLDGNLVSA